MEKLVFVFKFFYLLIINIEKEKIIKPIGKIKKGGNKSEDNSPSAINLSKIFKLYNFFYFQGNNPTFICF